MKVLLLDIETAPHLATVWGLWQQNVATNQLLEVGYVLCWSAKWYGSSELYFDSIERSGEKKMLRVIHKLLEEADVVVTYNGQKFDVPTLNREFVTSGMKPPAPYKQVDLYRTAKRQFRFASNKLDFIAQELGLGHKHRHSGHQMWLDCMKGEEAAWKAMETYNKGDVVLLEALYNRLRPWVSNHPNSGTYADSGALMCPACGSTRLEKRGHYHSQVNKYVRYRCKDCATWTREAYGEFNKEQRGTIARPVPQN